MKLVLGALCAIASLVLSGCETTSSNTGGGSPAADVTKVEKGMTKAEVLTIMGDPDSIETVVNDTIDGEIWKYKQNVTVSSTIESDGEQERVYIDHNTGEMVTVREPIFRNEAVKAEVTIELLFIGDELQARKEKVVDGILDVGH